ncbi:hypothetical protein KFL_004840090 [Klebsormidium nitens]|uniref:Uncharacterized protein n=1 Tax=Klebsormidium nitens TaxID=105231 RepID=A0A1Y1IDS2_KLENI|nr:hypothetical protein KFL_004840090 [Klebsormidium nitens]|eukprot:GAQ89070.1 hypothetical protein KFL_004840090 [Klebsormidium nitens]
MARSRPCGRSKSDHRVCQAARFARAAEYRKRVEISAERQAFLIAAVNAQSDDIPAPGRRRCQRSERLKNEGQPARKGLLGRRFTAAGQKAKRQDPRVLKDVLDCVAEHDPHGIHCCECNTAAEFGLRGSKNGGNVRYCCERHGPTEGCFHIDRDRTAWVQGREKTRRKANAACLEREQHRKGSGSLAALWSRPATAGSSCADRDALRTRHAATASRGTTRENSELECSLGSSRHQYAASLVTNGAQRGEPSVRCAVREGQCALLSRSARFEVQSSGEPIATSSYRPVLQETSSCAGRNAHDTHAGRPSPTATNPLRANRLPTATDSPHPVLVTRTIRSRLQESSRADRDAYNSPRTIGPSAIAGGPKSDCGLGPARHQHAGSNEAQPGQPSVHRAEGPSCGGARFGVQRTATKSVLMRSAVQGSQGTGVHDARHADKPSAAAATRPTFDPSEHERVAASLSNDEARCAQRPAREGRCAPSDNLRPGRFPATSSRRTALSKSQGSTCTDRDAHNMRHAAGSPSTTATASPRASGDNSESECCLRAGRHQSAASLVTDGAQRWQRAEREGQCVLSSRSARVGAQSSRQPTATSSHHPLLVRSGLQGFPAYGCGSDKVFYSSAPKSRALIATQLMIGGVESNPGWPTHDPDAPSSSCGRPLIHLPTTEEVQKSVRSKPVSTEPFDAWRASQLNPNWVAEVMARSPVQPAQPQLKDPPTAPSASNPPACMNHRNSHGQDRSLGSLHVPLL